MVTMHENPDYLLEAVKAGVAGYVLKDAGGERLVEAVRSTLEEESPLDQGLAMRLLRRLAKESKGSAGEDRRRETPAGLTPREVEVVRLLAQGLTNPQITQAIGASRGTVKIHVQHIIAKLGVSDRTQAAVHAVELGLAAPETWG